MRLELYLAETARIAHEQTSLLDEARQRLLAGQVLNRLEEGGVLHALQILVENAIGKAKHTVKACNAPVPVSAYELSRHCSSLAASRAPPLKNGTRSSTCATGSSATT